MNQVLVLILMILSAAFSRLIPHPWNFTAIGAMALFGGTYFQSKRDSLIVPLLALFLSDLVIGLHSTMIYVYAPFLLTVLLGWSLRQQQSIFRLGTMALVSGALFFLSSNFGVWIGGQIYAPTWDGLIECYVAAIPFYANQIFGDLFYSAVLFGCYELAKQRGLIQPSKA